MANQRRMIYAKIFENEAFGELTSNAKLTYIGTIVFADDDGKLKANSSVLKGKLFPLNEDITKEDVKSYIGEIVKKKMVTFYKVGTDWFIAHPKWKEYQILRKDLYKKSTIPDPVTVPLRRRNARKKEREERKESVEVNSTPFSLKEEITKLENSPRRDLNVIALYFEHRKPNFENYAQYEVAFKRHLKAAKDVKVFNDDQILKALDKAKKLCPDDYTIETIKKMLTK